MKTTYAKRHRLGTPGRPGKIIKLPTPTAVRRRRAARLALALLAIAAGGALVGRIYLLPNAPSAPERFAAMSAQEQEIMRLVNSERVGVGRKPLELSPRLAVVARGHSYDMAIRRYFAHSTPEGAALADRVRGVGIAYRELGENIYTERSEDRSGTARRAVEQWLKSPRHRDNLLSQSFTKTGVGVARAADGSIYITEDFIR
jgi:uncharacterized protein YkwD